jgi:hypothetical protein
MRVVGLFVALGFVARAMSRPVGAWRASRRVRRLAAEGEAQLALGSCASDLMSARDNLRGVAPNSPVVAVLDDRIRHLHHTPLNPRALGERTTPFPCL